ncbi:MAG: hypothetical protein IJ099_01940 [Alphaproteobacteria bacterium]|nr:hypothetical protein [Alphaproteobacteria bacterium]
MRQYKNEQSGRSMIEMMGYIAVVMSITVSVGYLVSKAYGDYKFSKASLQLSDLANSITKAGAIEPNYAEIVSMVNDKDNAEGKKIIPETFRVNENGQSRQIYHAFGGSVTIGHPDGDTTKFSIKFDNLNRNQCIEMAMKDWLQNKYADLYSITVNTAQQWNWPVYSGSSGNTLPIKRSAVAGKTADDTGACSEATGNNIMWVFN